MNLLLENFLGEYQIKVDYVVDFINEHPVCPEDVNISTNAQDADMKICYGGDPNRNEFFIPAQRKVFSNEQQESKILFANKFKVEEREVFSVEESSKDVQPFLVDKQFQFDLIETIFFHLSRYEEFHCSSSEKDRWDMKKEETQFLVRNKLEKRPVVDHLVFSFLKSLGLNPQRIKSKIRITHDIDLITKFKSPLSFLRFNAYYLKNWKGAQPIGELWKSYYRFIAKGEKAYDVFSEMLVEENCDKEIYFLIGGKEPVDTPLDTQSEIFKNAISLSKERGYKIGIHPSYATWKNRDMLIEEKSRLEKIIGSQIVISRQHYLHFSFTDTIEILEAAGITQDSTIGYNRIIGFRAGTGVGFKLYDLKNNRVSSVLEKPLAIMDSSLFDESKCKAEKFLAIAEDFLEANNEGTEITCNFHNSRFDDAKMFGLPQQAIYKKMING